MNHVNQKKKFQVDVMPKTHKQSLRQKSPPLTLLASSRLKILMFN
jgi:hypothetical protein